MWNFLYSATWIQKWPNLEEFGEFGRVLWGGQFLIFYDFFESILITHCIIHFSSVLASFFIFFK